jgi:phosphoribosyl-ATP pyrophosphohydrolase/phosphoribosyl-AMP cyclohydrolase
MNALPETIDWNKGGGLLPAIVQNLTNGRVLMLGYMNEEALAKTHSSGLVTFFSRSRQCLWTKGEKSGNTLRLDSIRLDCDGDALLVQASPSGPTCHLEKTSCFDADFEQPGFGFLGQLENIIADRINDQSAESYTAELVQSGVKRIAQKVGEEALEVALAAAAGNSEEIIAESADLLYHLLVLLKQQQLNIDDVAKELQQRHNA